MNYFSISHGAQIGFICSGLEEIVANVTLLQGQFLPLRECNATSDVILNNNARVADLTGVR